MAYTPPHKRNQGAEATPPSDAKKAHPSNGGDEPNPPAQRGSEPIIGWWQPSERVQAMTDEQAEEVRERLSLKAEGKSGSTSKVPAPIELFDDMGLSNQLGSAIRSRGFQRPTPIQAQGMPVALAGMDALACAETGSGKTLAFALPLLHHCLHQPPLRRQDGPLALILAPTRELAHQIKREIDAFTPSGSGLRSSIAVGGETLAEQRSGLHHLPSCLVATPGRLIDHLMQGNTNLMRASFVVLDEADRMLDLGFEPQMREILSSLPEQRQTLLFSATMPEEVETLAEEHLVEPVRLQVGQVSCPTRNVSQHLERAQHYDDKVNRFMELMLMEKQQAERHGHDLPRTLVFTERKVRCDEVATMLSEEGIATTSIHGDRNQEDRTRALRDFREGRCSVLVATDVASRGLDVSGIGHVVNLDLPRHFEDYVHRIGRTGRAGAMGRSTSFYTDRDSFLVTQIQKTLKEMEKGNTVHVATGKAQRQREAEVREAFKRGYASPEVRKEGSGVPSVAVEDQFRQMSAPLRDVSSSGAADAAWDD